MLKKLTMLTSEMESMLAIFMLIPTMTGGPERKEKERGKKGHVSQVEPRVNQVMQFFSVQDAFCASGQL